MDPSIVLTALTEADADFIAQLAADKRITAYIGDGQPWSDQYTGQRIEDAINSPEISWFVARRDGIRVGLFTAVQREQATEIGYWIAPEFWGQGLAKAIVALGIKALNAVGFSQLMARVMPENKASLKVLQRHGFVVQEDTAELITLRQSAVQSPPSNS